MVQYRLGMAVFQVEGPCTACGSVSDKEGGHAIACGGQGERIARHNQLRDALFQAAAQAALGPTQEERALIPGREDRPADVFLPSWTGGQDTACDVTVISPLQRDRVVRAAEEAGSALEFAFRRKMTASFDAYKEQGIHFPPLPIETLGGWHSSAVGAITKLARQLAR